MSERPSWDEYFIAMLNVVKTRSPDPNTQQACILVRNKRILATGYNGNISDVDTSDFPWTRDISEEWPQAKYGTSIHSEQNALAQCARYGIATEGATAYCMNMPCLVCLQALWQSGVREIIYPKGNTGTPKSGGKASYGVDDPKSKPYYDLIFKATKDILIIREV